MSFLKKELNRFAVAFSGFFRLLVSETHAKIHLAGTIIAVSVSYLLEISRNDWLWIALAISLIWITEAINTALERLSDYAAGSEHHPLIKDAKDIAASAVLLASFFALLVAGLVWF